MAELDPVLEELLERCRADHQAWINGDATAYALPSDGTILGGIGGYAHGGPETASRQMGVAARWRSGSGVLEYLNGGVEGALAWLTFVERAQVTFEDDDQRLRRWDLRVTEIFRLRSGAWERVHRHADPLVDRRPLAEVVDLLGDPGAP